MEPLTASEARALNGTYDEGFKDLFDRIRDAATQKERRIQFSAYSDTPWAKWIFQFGFEAFKQRMAELGYTIVQVGMARFNIYWHPEDAVAYEKFNTE